MTGEDDSDLTIFKIGNTPFEGEVVFRINRDGSLWVNPKWTATEAAKLLWDAFENEGVLRGHLIAQSKN